MSTDMVASGIAATAPTLDPELVRYADSMDCMQVNLAVLGNLAHGPSTDLRLGRRLRLRGRRGADGLSTVETSLVDQLADARDDLGLTVTERREDLTAAELLDDLGAGRTYYVVADAFDLEWTPYARRRHMDHSFLVTGCPEGVEIIDAYHNDTPWGQARPARWTVTREEFAGLPVRLEHVIHFAATPLSPDGDHCELTVHAIEDYLAGLRSAHTSVAGLTSLALEAWLLNRSRRLRAYWLIHRFGIDPTALEPHLTGWRLVSERVYLAQRRAERGKAIPSGLVDLFAAQLRADLDTLVSAGPVSPVVEASEPGRAESANALYPASSSACAPLLLETIAGVFDISVTDCAAVRSLTSLTGYSSLRLVQLVEALESTFGIEFDTDDLDPVQLHELDFLQQLVDRKIRCRPGPLRKQAS